MILVSLLSDPPILSVKPVSPVDLDQIREGDDLQLNCKVDANPPIRYINWYHGVSHNLSRSAACQLSNITHNKHSFILVLIQVHFFICIYTNIKKLILFHSTQQVIQSKS